MGVPFYNFTDIHDADLKKRFLERVENIYDTNGFVEGEFNRSFEKRFAQKQGAKHALLVANGTDALEISLLASGIRAGDKVGVPGITFYASAEAILNVGAEPVFIDVDSTTGLMDPQSTKRVIENYDLKAIMPVHIYGLPAAVEEVQQFCDERHVAIIEDAAQAQGAFLKEGPMGSSRNLTIFSFYPTKNLAAFGDAGAVLTQDDDMALKIKTIRNHGRSELEMLGRNSRCDHIQAAILDLKLDNISDFNRGRKKAATLYHQALGTSGLTINLIPQKYLESSSWHLYPIQLESRETREKMQAFFKKNEIGCTPFYDQALHQMKVLNKFSGETENAEKFAGCTLCLPINPLLKASEVEEVVETIRKFFQ